MLMLFHRNLLLTLALALAVYLAARLGLLVTIGTGHISAVWPAAGVALAALMMLGRRAVAGLALGTFCASWFHFLGAVAGFDARSALGALALAAGSLAEAGLAACWLRRLPDRLREAPVRQTLRFVRIAALCCVVGATVGEATLHAMNVARTEVFFGWLTWWLGDLTGMLVAAPPLLFLLHPRLREDRLALPAFPLLTLGVGLTLFTSFAVSIVERNARSERFAADVGRLAMTLQADVDLTDRDLETLQQYFYGVDISAAEFRAVSRPLLRRNPWQSTFAWLPRVTQAERNAFETSPKGLGGAWIRQVTPDGSVVRAPVRDEYFPVAWTDPEAGREALLGIDHLVDPTRGAALALARASGRPAAAPPTASIAISPEARVIQTLYAPISAKSHGADQPYEASSVRGIVAATTDIARLFQTAIEQMGIGNQTVLLYDPEAPLSPALQWSDGQRMRLVEADQRDEVIARLSGGVSRRLALRVADRQWTVLAQPAWASTMPEPSWLQLAVLGSGLAFTALLTGFLVVRRRRDEVMQGARRQLEHEVAVRTQDLASTNRQLVDEVAGHRRTEALLQRAQAHAEAASQAKSQFLANMSHEIRTPLNAVLGFAQLLIEDRRLPPDARDRMGIILAAGNRLLGLINDVLDLAKIEAGGVQVNAGPVDLRRELEEIAQLFAPRAGAKGLRLRTEIALDGGAALLLDRAKFGQIVLNLLGNALKFTDHGSITLRAWRAEGDTVVEVEDTGPGMDEAEVSQAFVPFRQGSAGQAKGGTGLGLPLSRNLAQALGGDLAITSVPGHGTRVRLRLPTPEARMPGASAPVFPGRQRLAPGEHCRVLVVEDDPFGREVLVSLLRRAGCEVQEAEDGQAGLEACRAMRDDAPFDIVFSDIRMPRLDGLQMLHAVREDARLRDLPMVAISASSLEHERRFYIGQGFQDFVSKPYDFGAIHAALAQHAGVRLVAVPDAPAGEAASSRVLATPPVSPARDAEGLAAAAGDAAFSATVHEHLRALAHHASRGALQAVRQDLATLAALGPHAVPADLRAQLEADLRAYDFVAIEARVRAVLGVDAGDLGTRG